MNPRRTCAPRSLSSSKREASLPRGFRPFDRLRAPQAHPACRRLNPADETGSTLLLTIFFGFLSLVLILLVVAATSLYLERKRLFTLADGAALVGAEAFELDSVTMTTEGPRPILESGDVTRAVSDYLSAAPHNFENLAVERAETVDGRSATVQLSADWRPPMVSLLVPEGIRIDVTAVARSVFS